MMREDVARPVALALHDTLSDFHALNGHRLLVVCYVFLGSCLDRIVLDFDNGSLLVTCEPDDDSIDLRLVIGTVEENGHVLDMSRSDEWNSFIGKPFGWGWITVNQQGYCDGLLLSFEGIQPQVLLNVTASSIFVHPIAKPIRR